MTEDYKPKTAREAYDHTMLTVHELFMRGIQTKTEASKRQNDSELVAKYNGPERVAPELWVRVHFYPTTEAQKNEILDAGQKLNMLGIGFDTGGCAGQRDWELDWSFRYTGKPETELKELQANVEELVRKVLEDNRPTGWTKEPCPIQRLSAADAARVRPISTEVPEQ